MLLVRAWIWATCALAASSGACAFGRDATIEIATTTSVENSGLLGALLPAYREASGLDVRVHAAGSGRALQMLGDGLVQLVISHAPGAELAALKTHHDWVSQRLAHNGFIVVGPSPDPADVRRAIDAADAFRKIAKSRTPFVTRGDQSGTHERELALWTAAAIRPEPARYITSGRGMAQAMRHADEAQGYTLADEATFLQLAPELDLELLYRGDPALLNIYSVIYPASDREAARFAEWLVSGNGRELIRGFTVAGRRVFEVDGR